MDRKEKEKCREEKSNDGKCYSCEILLRIIKQRLKKETALLSFCDIKSPLPQDPEIDLVIYDTNVLQGSSTRVKKYDF